MKKSQKLTIQGETITLVQESGDDYISLTDIAKFKNAERTGVVIGNWISTRYAVEFMGGWEKIYNPNFNVMEFNDIRNESGSNGYFLSLKQWTEKTKAVGIRSKAGRLTTLKDE